VRKQAFDSVVKGLTEDPEIEEMVSTVSDSSHTVPISGEYDEVNEYFLKQGWTDGLPIVLPTKERVEKMLKTVARDPKEVLGYMPPRWQKVTVEKVAINAVMAGCADEYFPVVLTVTEALLDPAFNLYVVQATTNPAGPMVIINGPIAKKLDVNAGIGLFGPGWRANATIGRVVRLMLFNLGGGRPGIGDMSTLGNPAKYSGCIAEYEEKSPWEALHVELGYDKGDSTVTVVSSCAPQNVIDLTVSAEPLIESLTNALLTEGSNQLFFDMQPVIVISPVHADVLNREGFDKQKVKQVLYQKARFKASRFEPKTRKTILEWKAKYIEEVDGEVMIKIAEKPEDIMIVVAGGDGEHSAILGTFNSSRNITKKIR
jgi:hypothetical protein